MSRQTYFSGHLVRRVGICLALAGVGLLGALLHGRHDVAAAAAGNVVIAVEPNGIGSVSVSPTPTAVDEQPTPAGAPDPKRCTGSLALAKVCSYSYAPGTKVTLTAEPDTAAGSSFRGWSDADCPATPQCVVTLTEAQYLVALFSPQSIGVRLAGAGSVARADGTPCTPSVTIGLDCGPVDLFSVVTLVATAENLGDPVPRWLPSGIGGPLCDAPPVPTAATPTVRASATCTVFADRFRWTSVAFGVEDPIDIGPPPNPAPLTVKRTGSGSVNSRSAKIACPPRCDYVGARGSVDVLTATANPDWRFSRWVNCRPMPAAPKSCTASVGFIVRAIFEAAATAPVSSVVLLGRGVTGHRGRRRVRFVVDLGAAGTVRASLIRNKRNYAKPYSRNFPEGLRNLSVGVRAGAPRGSYRLKVKITGAAPTEASLRVPLPR